MRMTGERSTGTGSTEHEYVSSREATLTAAAATLLAAGSGQEPDILLSRGVMSDDSAKDALRLSTLQ